MEEKKILTAEEEAESLAEQARIRREKLQKLVAEGNDPFGKLPLIPLTLLNTLPSLKARRLALPADLCPAA